MAGHPHPNILGVGVAHPLLFFIISKFVFPSFFIHDFKFCKCGAVAVDGGKEYLRRCGNREGWEDLSEVIDDTRE